MQILVGSERIEGARRRHSSLENGYQYTTPRRVREFRERRRFLYLMVS
jgi:hypothetical protein